MARYLSNGQNSAFNAENLEDALKLISDWENKFSDAKFYADFKKNIADDITKTKYRSNKWKHTQQFFSELEELFIESKALMYPQLLPQVPFKSGIKKNTKSTYCKSEEK